MEILTAGEHFERKGVPKWLQIEQMSFREYVEIVIYKFVSILPVICTFFLIVYISVFYVFVSNPSPFLTRFSFTYGQQSKRTIRV